jgi:SRSO17 transposase
MIPDKIKFKTKLEISLELLKDEAIQSRFTGKWVGADAFFGSSAVWCDEVEKSGLKYFASIRGNQLFWTEEPKIVPVESLGGRGRPPKEGAMQTDPQPAALKNIIRQEDIPWEKVILAEGTKGPIAAEVAILRVIRCENNLPSKKMWLIVRKDEDGSVHYYISNASVDIEKKEFYRVLSMRWSIEQCFEDGKKYLGMDHYEHRSWPAWHRHMLFVFLAMYFLHRLRIKYKKNSIEYAAANETSHSSRINDEAFHDRKSRDYDKLLS